MGAKHLYQTKNGTHLAGFFAMVCLYSLVMNNLSELFTIADRETKAGHNKAAIQAYQQILQQSEAGSQAQHLAHWGIGDIYLNDKQYDKAELHLKKAIELKSDEPIYHYLLGCTYRYINNVEGALYHLQKALDLDPSREQFWGELGWVVGHNQDAAKGIEYLKKSLAINPTNPNSLRDICMLYAKSRKWSEAQVCIEEAEKQDPDSPLIRKLKKDVAFFRSEFERLSGKPTP